MDKKQILQSLLFKIPAIKQTKKTIQFQKVVSSFEKEQQTNKALGLDDLIHPNQRERSTIGSLALLNPQQNHRMLDQINYDKVKLYSFDPLSSYEMKGKMTVVSNSCQDKEGPQRESNVIMISQLRANNLE